MPADIEQYEPASGRMLQEDGTVVNVADSIGTKSDTAISGPTEDASIIAAIKGILKQLQGGGSGTMPVTLAASADSTVTHNAITANTTSTLMTAPRRSWIMEYTCKGPSASYTLVGILFAA